MSKRKTIFAIFLLFAFVSAGYSATAKWTAQTAITSLTTDDICLFVNDPGGTAASRKITWDNVMGSINKTGTIATGTWQGTDVGVAYGGTGASTFTDGSPLFGSATGAITALGVLADGEIIIGDGTGDPVYLDVGSSTGITILGTIATGVWQGTDIGVQYGGTGLSSLDDGFVLLGSGTGAITPLDVTTDGAIIIGDGSTDPVTLDVGSSTAITILGTIATGVWQGTAIADGYIPDNITIDLATLATTLTITDNEDTAENNPIVFVAGAAQAGGNLGLESDGTFYYTPSTGTVTTTEFVGSGSGLTSVDAATGDSATAFFDAGTIEHERGGLEADVSGYTDGLYGQASGATANINTLAELVTAMSDVSAFITDAIMPAAGTDPDVDAAGELSVDTDGANEPNDVILRTIDGAGTQVCLAQQQKSIQATITKPNDLADATRDLCPIWSNETGMSFVITKIEAWSDTDDTTVNVEVYDSVFGNNATIDALEIAGDGTANYYVTETTITAATIAANYIIALDFDDTDDPGWVKISICGYFLSDVD